MGVEVRSRVRVRVKVGFRDQVNINSWVSIRVGILPRIRVWVRLDYLEFRVRRVGVRLS